MMLKEAVRLLSASARNFKSRQVAEARRLIETVLTQLEVLYDQKENPDRETDPHATRRIGRVRKTLDHD
jgi:hypothetical protein